MNNEIIHTKKLSLTSVKTVHHKYRRSNLYCSSLAHFLQNMHVRQTKVKHVKINRLLYCKLILLLKVLAYVFTIVLHKIYNFRKKLLSILGCRRGEVGPTDGEGGTAVFDIAVDTGKRQPNANA